MQTEKDFFEFLDRIAVNTWPAETSSMVDHWLVRASQGITKRANSVFAVGPYPREDNWLSRVEQFYHSHGLPAIFHISHASPEQLDLLLQDQGYELDTPCLMMTADSSFVAAKALTYMQKKYLTSLSVDVHISETLTPEWLDAFLHLEKYPEERRSFYQGLCDRMPSPKAFISLKEGGQIVALGTAIVEGTWAGFVNVIVHEEHRGKGYGYAILHAMTTWSMTQGAAQQYLQVISNNTPAVSLYGNLGYQTKYGYHYRVKYDLTALVSS
ncbi:GNAT family N-acetyltransferase [Paenibacillus qinlingensis]|uniref:GNAT superfamily N-acetyltransferase n=1 Tax=Paenibacillus qinlingensis TaxID=1837343 RepID=A0ABU1NQ87_9BACL|nr:GNAT family N-acetyltransferase [Paenibacillus qinlingensis]MDR6549642.1 GNAT superfamily N-acetyltransferase [Paenibacillus qinlingensis]